MGLDSHFATDLSFDTLVEEEPNVPQEARAELSFELQSRLTALVDDSHLRPVFGQSLWLAKGRLSDLMDCGARILHPQPFTPTLPIAEGMVSEHAVLHDLRLREPADPDEVVARAVESYLARADGRRPDPSAQLVASLTDASRAELQQRVAERVRTARELLPSLDVRSTRISTQRDVRVKVGDGRVTLAGIIDLHLVPRTQRVPLSAHVELKTGSGNLTYRLHEPKYYALLEALLLHAPLPQRVGIVNLDTRDHQVFEVDTGLLREMADDVVTATERYVALTHPDGPQGEVHTCGRDWCGGCAA